MDDLQRAATSDNKGVVPMRVVKIIAMIVVLVLAGSASSFSQGVQTGTIRGAVRDQQNLPVPGATVTVTSATLQGARTVVTDSDGAYALSNLPPGQYQVKFELNGFTTVTQSTSVLLGLTVEVNVGLQPAGVAETVNVVAETPAPIATPVGGANFMHEEIEQLSTPRSLEGISTLSPSLTENSPNVGQVVINGAFAFDNIFMVNGVDVNDNLFASPQNLFIEDAIQETQVLTSGISAEYGRFSGGVVNAITKSGGNTFSGSGRVNFLNPSWTTPTPFEVSKGPATVDAAHPNDLQTILEGTFGGPIVKDALWFFASGRYASLASPQTLAVTGTPVSQDDLNKRGEIKLTGTVAQNHTIQGGYLNNARSVTNTSGIPISAIIDTNSLITRSLPNWYYYTNYRGVLKSNLLAEAQYSERRFRFSGDGGTSTNIVDSPFITQSTGLFYNAPYFDTADQESRNNRQLTGSVTSLLEKAGRHEIKTGYEYFRSQRTGGNSQSSTSYVFNSDYLAAANGTPIFDAEGRFIPMFIPGVSSVDYYPATRGAVLDINNHSIYVQDHWRIGAHWSADLGARFEHVTAVSTGDITSVDTNRIVPRFAASYDVQGNGDQVIHLTYGQYSGRYNEAQIAPNSPVGNPADIFTVYAGPAGQGRNFAPGFDPRNYPVGPDASVTVPTANVFTDGSLSSPLTNEFTASYGANLRRGRGYAEASYVYRKTGNLIEDYQTIAGGFTHVVAYGIDAGDVTNIIYRNTNDLYREYQGLVFQSRYRITNRWSVNGNYTVQLENNGNYEGEGTSRPGRLSFFGNYPEAFNATRNFPDGRLQDFERNRVRLWSIYDLDMGHAGDLSVSGLWRIDSGQVYSLAARDQSLTTVQKNILVAAGYPDAPSTVGNMVFFAPRGSETFPGYALVDMSVNYNVPVGGKLRPWVKLDIYNLFDNLKLIAWNTTITQNRNGPLDNLGLATTYIPGSTFGTATGNTVTNLNNTGFNTYPIAFSGATRGGRTFRVAVGVRF
jgi:hypothetical protein